MKFRKQSSRSRQRRNSPSISTIKHSSPEVIKRHRFKKQRLRSRQPQDHQDQASPSGATTSKNASFVRRRPRKASIKSIPSKEARDLWANMADETLRIALGDGKYVEERYNLPATSTPNDGSDRQTFPQSSFVSDASGTTYTVRRIEHDIFLPINLSRQSTEFYSHNCDSLSTWAASKPRTLPVGQTTTIDFRKCSTLTAARRLSHLSEDNSKVGVLSFASPKRPCGNFLHGSSEQEETMARYTSLVANLTSSAAQNFYKEHRKFSREDGCGLHDHSLVHSPGVVVFRSDSDDADASHQAVASSPPIGGSFIPPYQIDVVSAVPVNAAAIRAKSLTTFAEKPISEEDIRSHMKERMGRVLRLFEEKGNKNIVLGAFGCSSSENKVDVVAGVWAELLVCGDMEGEDGTPHPARFKDVFSNVVFAIPGKMYPTFKEAFELRLFEAQLIESFSAL